MSIEDDIQAFWQKAEQNLAAAESELGNHRYDTCASRCYYACFLAAIAALLRAGIRLADDESAWSHKFVQSQFSGQLITRRKLYPARLTDVLSRLLTLRHTADYDTDFVSATQARRALDRAHDFLATLQRGGERP